ncbi:DUF475 domain-containing protein [Porphyrobacter sp. CACIAM 03H1]|uniref:DUF475 domain-containing protein n=1 Tax=Porphyrobacter sp. CACIAM 03H1 TaxID=2003315 RepID=UPI000B5A3411|nr:DUF475 domain-containing protein [Porphyrobacter sp. CACIAM 03H1]ASJ90098.1 hypothetical protein CBR61_03545 [Porphyrobacter sp. CACIAM 03H1]
MFKHFGGSLLFTLAGLVLGGWYGWELTGTIDGMLGIVWICAVLAVLEVSLSFDNAAVNASILKDMDPVWQRRFLTWGIAIAVFGMRIVFPLVIVMVAAALGPVEAMQLALNEPAEYQRIVSEAHVGLMGFGGAFLGMVGLKYFFDAEKEVNWIEAIERPLAKVANIEAIAIGVVLAGTWAVASVLPGEEALTFLIAAIAGLLTYLAVEIVNHLLEPPTPTTGDVAKAGFGAFLYLEVLDASFSFDGVIGAFALTNNLIIIAIGLGIGAMFVRSMTIFLVNKGTMSEYRYLEHGAFYAIIALAVIMYLNTFVHIPEVITGVIGAVLIGLAFWSSVRWNRANGTAQPEDALA